MEGGEKLMEKFVFLSRKIEYISGLAILLELYSLDKNFPLLYTKTLVTRN